MRNLFDFINLNEFYNHKFIYLQEEIAEDHVDYLRGEDGYFFVLDNETNYKEIIELNNVPFLFPYKKNSKYDNIICNSQIIFPQVKSYSYIHLLGCGLHQDFNGKIRAEYENGEIENVSIMMKSWWGGDLRITRHEEKEKLEFMSSKKIYKCIDKIFLFHNVCSFQNNKNKLKSLQLPDNEFIRIFSMTLQT